VKERKKQQLVKLGRLGQLKEDSIHGTGKSSSENERDDGEDEDGQVWGRKSNISLLDQHTELKKLAEGIFYVFKVIKKGILENFILLYKYLKYYYLMKRFC
jgi:hypothetical protein